MRSSGLSVNGSTEDVGASGSVQIDAQAQGKALPSLDAVMSLNAGKEVVEAEISGFAPWGAFGQRLRDIHRHGAGKFCSPPRWRTGIGRASGRALGD